MKYAALYGSISPSKQIALAGARTVAALTGGKPLDLLPKGFNPDRDIELGSDTIGQLTGMLGALGGGTTEKITKARRKKMKRN